MKPQPALSAPGRLHPGAAAVRQLMFGLIISTALMPGLVPTAQAQAVGSAALDGSTLIDYRLPAMPLSRSLAEFAAQSGILLSFDPALASQRQAPALQGTYTAREGMNRLLSNSGLELVSRPDGSYTLQKIAGPVATLPNVTVEGTAPDSAERAVYTEPRSSVYLSEQQLRRFVPLSPGDMLKGVPGVQVGDSRNGGGLDVNIRGIQGQSRVAITVDGAQQALDVYRGYAGTQQRSYIDPDLISNVTIDKGPGLSAATGGNAIGGTVAMRTIGVNDIIPAGQSVGVRITGEMWNNGNKPAHRSRDGSNYNSSSDLYSEPESKHGNLFGSNAQAGSIAFGYTSEKVDLVAAYAHRTQGNYFSGKHGYDRYVEYESSGREKNTVAKMYKPGEEVLNSSVETESVLVKTTIRPAAGHALELSYRRYNGRQGEVMPSDIIRSGTAGIYQYPTGKTEIDTTSLRYNFNPADNPWIDLKSNLWFVGARTSQINGVMAPRSEMYVGDRGWVRLNNRRIGMDLSNRSEFSSNIGDFAFELGGSFQAENLSPQAGVTITEDDRNANRILRDGKRQEINLTGKLEYKPTDRLTLWTGVRFSKFKSRDRNTYATAVREDREKKSVMVFANGKLGYMDWYPDENGEYTDATDPLKNNGFVYSDSNPPEVGVNLDEFGEPSYVAASNPMVISTVVGYSHSEPLSSHDHGIAPAFGISYELAPDTQVYASYSTGIRLPSLFETSLGTLQVSPVQNLKPERSRNLELGFSTIHSGVLSSADLAAFKFAYFRNDVKNYITRYYDPTLNGSMTFSNADSYQASGQELQSQYDNGRIFTDLSATHYLKTRTCDAAFAANLRAKADRYMPTENTPDCTPGSFMGSYTNTQNPPKYAVNLTVGTRWLDQRLTVGSRMTFTSGPTEKMEEPWQQGDTTPQLIYHPVTLVDAFLSYQFHKMAAVNVSLQNITNRYYLDPLAQSMMPAPGRTLRVGLQVQM
ncbi:hemoglobin/transferrin/lactoferrin receptor protein [Kerstersia gyiorum]|uniref:TonB-dependent receptor n=1 Tax=Kerstersia gyiorum TaxID=206506 RepID=UPI00209D9BFA|nr:TonB-dependent receptor [Kerstersia gyiorum]MCP1713285.1 hemoglobin/transferrin/lactoferrin receptor protein [Kerstersia gyiorum]